MCCGQEGLQVAYHPTPGTMIRMKWSGPLPSGCSLLVPGESGTSYSFLEKYPYRNVYFSDVDQLCERYMGLIEIVDMEKYQRVRASF